MLLNEIVKDGRTFKRKARYINRRTRVNTQVIEVAGESKKNEQVTYRVFAEGSDTSEVKRVSTEEFAEFVEKTFGGWEDVIKAEREAVKAAEVEARRLAEVAAAREVAVEMDAKMEAFISAGFSRDEVYDMTVRAINRARNDAYSEGYKEGRKKGRGDGGDEFGYLDDRGYWWAYDED
jgi:flagellar biosynthesis/type III secretory pathway protein FliH